MAQGCLSFVMGTCISKEFFFSGHNFHLSNNNTKAASPPTPVSAEIPPTVHEAPTESPEEEEEEDEEDEMGKVSCDSHWADTVYKEKSGTTLGVAEQFAITEATLSAWSSLDDEEMHYGLGSQEVRQLQDLESIYLQGRLLSYAHGACGSDLGGSLPGLCYSSAVSLAAAPQQMLPVEMWDGTVDPSLQPAVQGSFVNGAQSSSSDNSRAPAAGENIPEPCKLRLNSSLHYVDSSSLSEDEVFYN
ncbi:LOW QUALITY PROTEIN: protein FAM131C [Rhinophrynus dorsalis]